MPLHGVIRRVQAEALHPQVESLPMTLRTVRCLVFHNYRLEMCMTSLVASESQFEAEGELRSNTETRVTSRHVISDNARKNESLIRV